MQELNSSLQQPSPKLPVKTLAAATAVAFFLIALCCLYIAHPAEDAFILFKYVDNFVGGRGIVYYVGGPRTEGATDFLWFAALSVLTWLGLDVALSAAVINAFGSWLIAYVLLEVVQAASWGSGLLKTLLGLFICVVTLFTGGALAGYMGFGSVFFTGATLYLASRLINPGRLEILFVPLLSLAVALIRPDGVILGGAFAVIGLVMAWNRGQRTPYLLSTLAAVLLGGIYFICRWKYFGLLLPLPLYVKGHGGDLLPGLPSHLLWLRSTSGPLLTILALIWLSLLARDRSASRRDAALWLVFLIPAVLHLAALLAAHQYQNQMYRFQSPDFALLIFSLLGVSSVLVRSLAAARQQLLTVVLIMLLCPTVAAGAWQLRRFVNTHYYLDTFSFELGRILGPNDTLVLSEAGRLAYWSRSRVIDAIGLNDPHTAVQPVTAAYVASCKPDMVLFDTSGSLDPDSLVPPANGPVLPVSPAALAERVLPHFREALHGEAAFSRLTPIELTPVVLTRFLMEHHDQFDVYLVQQHTEGAVYGHVIALRRDLASREQIMQEVLRSHDPSRFASYAQLKGFPFARMRPGYQ